VSHSNLEGCSVLLVENEPLIAFDIASELQRAGACVHSAGSVEQALAILDDASPSAAILDYRLGDGTADDICEMLTKRKIPFVVYSGYPEVEGACSKWGILPKPAAAPTLVEMVMALLPLTTVQAP
jgi:DNA-binding response OmpR family regulator